MPELDPAGYRWLRSRVYALWTWLAIVDDDGHELCRLNCETDPRIARTVNDVENEIEIEVSLRGDDPEFVNRLPVRIAATCLHTTPMTYSTIGSPNLCQYPFDIGASWWSKKNVTVTPNAIVAPDGTLTADTITEADAITTYRRVIRNYGMAANGLYPGQVYTFSSYLKAGSRPQASLTVYEDSYMRHFRFDLLTGEVTYQHGFFSNGGIEDAGNGWWRCFVTFTASGGKSGGFAGVYMGTASGAYSFMGDPENYPDGIGVWGVQMVPGTQPAPILQPDTDYRSLVAYTPATLSAATDGVVLTHRCHIPRSLLSEVI